MGAVGREDDPSLIIDNIDGTGPESISYPQPVATPHAYQVGVNYYGVGPFGGDVRVKATAEIHINGELIESVSHELDLGEFWVPFEITWSEDGEGEVNIVDHNYPRIEEAEVTP